MVKVTSFFALTLLHGLEFPSHPLHRISIDRFLTLPPL